MDSLDVAIKDAKREDSVSARNESSAQRQEATGAKLNISATASYLNMLSRERGLLSEGLSRSLNSVQSTLNEYVKNPQSIENVPSDEQTSTAAPYRKLSEQVISRDPQLQEKVAQNLSTAQRLVRSRDAASTLSNSLANLPDALQEGTAAGKALSRFICESLVDLTDHQTMGAGLERDLAVRNVYVPKEPLGQRSKQATNRALSTSIAYVESNQPQVLKKLPAQTDASSISTEKPGITTPQIMTRYLRQALNEFPDDTTYLDIFKQNRGRNIEEPYQDKISKDTAERIHSLISRAAETARRGNLIPGQNQQSAVARDNAAMQSEIAENVPAGQSSLKNKSSRDDARELSLAELSARAAKLQQQFREERQKLASEGKLPNPAEYPKNIAGNEVTTAQNKTSANRTVAERMVQNAVQNQPPLDKTGFTQVSEKPTAPQPQKTEVTASVPEETSAKTVSEDNAVKTERKAPVPSDIDLKSLNSASVNISYKAVQSSVYGAVSLTPGMTVPVSDFNATSIADSAQLQDLTTPRTLNQVLEEQQKFNSQKQTDNTAAEQQKNEAAAAQRAQSNTAEPVTREAEPSNSLTADEIAALKELAHSAASLQRTVASQHQNQEQNPQTDSSGTHNEAVSAQISQSVDPLSVLSEEESDALVEVEQQVTAAKQPTTEAADITPPVMTNSQASAQVLNAQPQQAAELIPEDTVQTQTTKVSVAEQAYAESAVASAQREQAASDGSKAQPAGAAIPTADDKLEPQSNESARLNQSTLAATPENTQTQDKVREQNISSLLNTTGGSADHALTESDEPASSSLSADNAESQLKTAVAAIDDDILAAEKAPVSVSAATAQPSQGITNTLEAADTPKDTQPENTAELRKLYGESLSSARAATDYAQAGGGDTLVNTGAPSAQAANNSAGMPKDGQLTLGQSVMSQTVHLNELDDNDTPDDVRIRNQNGDGRTENAGKQLTASINTAVEHTEDMMPKMSSPLTTPGAAAVTQGGSAPIPEQSVVEDLQPVKENGIFHKIASIFSKKTENSTAQAEKTAAQAIAGSGNAIMNLRGNPLDSLIYELRSQTENPGIPDRLREEARKFIKQLSDPVADLSTVSNWLNFVTGPMSPSSPQALGLHQWAFLLLCIRFSQLGKSIEKYLNKVKGEHLKEEIGELSEKMTSQKDDIKDILEETLDQVDRLQKFRENKEPNQLISRYIPLPPSYDGGREGGMSIEKQEDDDGQKSWHLTFNFDLPGLGPIEIKAVAKLPELRISVVTETLSGLQKVQECMPLLTKQLQDAGITTRTANARLGRISTPEQTQPAVEPEKNTEGSGLSIKI